MAVVTAQALYGLGGVGKTQLALEYAHRYQADYDLIWWIVAETPGAIPAGLAALAPRLGLVNDPTQVADQEELAAAVLEVLRRRARWLLVFDNVSDRQQLAPYLPQGDGQVLITSRHPYGGHRPAGQGRHLHPRRITGLPHPPHRQPRPDHCRCVGGGTGRSAVSAGAGRRLHGTDPHALPEYLVLFPRRREELLKRGEPTAYQGTVDTTWQLAIERVAIQLGGPAGVALLRLSAFLAPEAIPLDLLTDHPDLLPAELAAAARDELALGDAVAALYRYSLVDRDEAGLRVHRLVQAVVRNHLTPQERDTWAELAVGLLSEAFPTHLHEPATWPRCAQLLPHVLAAADHATSQPAAAAAAGSLLNRATEYLSRRAELRAARAAGERALAIFEAAYGPDHPEVAPTLTNLGIVLDQLGESGAARAAQERALAIGEAARSSSTDL